jgi:NhaP-type Na+/H+ or K+/H+ antiporter
MQSMTLLEKLDRLPPCFCRLLAQERGELMTDCELEVITGWSAAKLRRVAEAKSWARIKVNDVDAFLIACGLCWSAQRRHIWKAMRLLRTGGVHSLRRMRHLRKPIAQRASRVTTLLKRTEEVLSRNT